MNKPKPEYRRQYETLVEGMAQGVFSQLADGTLVDVNPAALELFGLDRDQFLGRTSLSPEWKVVCEDGTDLLPEQHPSMLALRTGLPVKDTVVGVYNPKKDSFFWLIANAIPIIRENEDTPYQVFVTLQDITDRKKAEVALHKREQLFRDFFESNPIPTIITSSSGMIYMINSSFSKASGFSVEEVLGKTSQELGFWRDLTDRERMVAAIRESGSINNLEAHFYTKSNQRLTCLVSSRAIEYEGEQRILSTVLDVTEQRKAEKALRKLEQAKSDFVKIAAHELQTPLVAILGYAELLEDTEQLSSADQQKQYAQVILKNAEILSRLVNDLLDIERVGLGHSLSIVKRKVSYSKLIKRVIASLTPKYPDYRFILSHENSLTEILCIDEDRITQVLQNLLINALKYSPGGGNVEISTSTEGNSVTTSITDYGVGMTTEQVERVFEMFYRANPENPLVGGLGLGMNIVKKVVEEHGGDISISSNPGKGTTVSFSLPLIEDY